MSFHYDDPFRDAWRCYRGLVPGGDLSVCIDLIGMLYRDQFSNDAKIGDHKYKERKAECIRGHSRHQTHYKGQCEVLYEG